MIIFYCTFDLDITTKLLVPYSQKCTVFFWDRLYLDYVGWVTDYPRKILPPTNPWILDILRNHYTDFHRLVVFTRKDNEDFIKEFVSYLEDKLKIKIKCESEMYNGHKIYNLDKVFN